MFPKLRYAVITFVAFVRSPRGRLSIYFCMDSVIMLVVRRVPATRRPRGAGSGDCGLLDGRVTRKSYPLMSSGSSSTGSVPYGGECVAPAASFHTGIFDEEVQIWTAEVWNRCRGRVRVVGEA